MSRRRHRKKRRSDPLAGFSIPEVAEYFLAPERLTTPSSIDSYVRRFCENISPGEEPVFLSPNPQPWSRDRFCNRNIERMISLHAGEGVLGFRIWYVEALYIEAERHAVWKTPEGTLVDISFYPDGEDRILFLPVPGMDTVVVAPHLKPRAAFHPKAERFIREQRKRERQRKFQYDDSWEAWEQAPSFEDRLH